MKNEALSLPVHYLANIDTMFTEKLEFSEDHEKLVREFHLAFLHENALNPMIYPCLRSVLRTTKKKKKFF